MKKQKEKINKEKKPLPKVLYIVLTVLLSLLILGGIGIGIFFLIKTISLKWFIFGAIFIAIPFGLLKFKELVFKKGNYTEEQNKQAIARIIVYTFFYWLCDLFYLSFIIDNLTLKFIFGGLIMVIVFYNLSVVFIRGNVIFKFGMIQDFLIGIALSVYLIYIIPNETLRDVIIPIISGVYGGLLTLVGVAWTIRKGEEQRKADREQLEKYRKEEERKKCVPYIKFESAIQPLNFVGFDQPENCILDDENKVYYSIYIKPFIIKNISTNNIILEKIILLGKTYELQNNKLLEAGGCCQVQLNTLSHFICSELPDKATLIISDIVGHLYSVDCFIVYRSIFNIPNVVGADNGKNFSVWEYDCFVQTISLPSYLSKEKTNE